MVGNFADVTTPEQKSKINHVTRWYKPWFYKHVETFLEKVTPKLTLIMTLLAQGHANILNSREKVKSTFPCESTFLGMTKPFSGLSSL
jgi:hypothetical protein